MVFDRLSKLSEAHGRVLDVGRRQKVFRLRFIAEVLIAERDLWPRSEAAPSDPSVKDVKDLITAHGGWFHILEDWKIADETNGSIEEIKRKPDDAA